MNYKIYFYSLMFFSHLLYTSDIFLLNIDLPSHKRNFSEKKLKDSIKFYTDELSYPLDERLLTPKRIQSAVLTIFHLHLTPKLTKPSSTTLISDPLFSHFQTTDDIKNIKKKLLYGILKTLETYYQEKNSQNWQPIKIEYSDSTVFFKKNDTILTIIKPIVL